MTNMDVSSNQCSKIVLPILELRMPNVVEDSSKQGKRCVWQRNEDFHVDRLQHFPVVLDSNGCPWDHANLYLLSKIKAIKPPKMTTIDGIANDLVVFKRFLDKTKIHGLDFPKRKLMRPTYMYRSELFDQIQDGVISPSTASRRMIGVIGFYRWLEKRDDCTFDHPPWQEKDVSISFLDERGFIKVKPVKSTDLAVRLPNNREDFSGRVQDGGKLRPLEKEEQKLLVEALKALNNPEMKLIFMVALTTGARIQTVLTLRVNSLPDAENGAAEVPIRVGPGTGVDTKFHKKMTLYLPHWLYNRLKAYASSQRAKDRRNRSKHQFANPGDHYLFLTRTGKPYYISEFDPALSSYRKPPNGGSVREFISSYLDPEIKKMQGVFTFRFHDLRATYGMNLLEEKMKVVEQGKAKLFDVLMFIKARMGHNSLRITEGYLELKQKFSLVMSVQSEFERYLMKTSATEANHEQP